MASTAPSRLASDPRLVATRLDLARVTRRGLGMTVAASLYWFGMAAVTAWAGLEPEPLALFFMLATLLVYPLGWALNCGFGGKLFARDHGFGGLMVAMTLSQFLAWPLLGAIFLLRIELIAFALAVVLGAHFLPYGWLYRSPSYFALGLATVLVATLLQWAWPWRSNLLIPLGMGACYALAAAGVRRENRRADGC